MNLLKGKVALVTGGSRGIGKAIAEAFLREGANCAICGRRQESLDAAAQDLAGLPGRVLPVACHVGKPEELSRLLATVERELGGIDIMVNNAGTNIAQGCGLDFDDAQFDKMFEINLKSAYRLIRLVAPGMCERGSGSIINVASVSGLQAQADSLLYCTTKAAMIMMTKCYALELGPKGVRVNAIAPGLVATKLSEYYWKDPERLEAFTLRQAIKRVGQPSEVAQAALLLTDDRCGFLTGAVITIDGGRTLG